MMKKKAGRTKPTLAEFADVRPLPPKLKKAVLKCKDFTNLKPSKHERLLQLVCEYNSDYVDDQSTPLDTYLSLLQCIALLPDRMLAGKKGSPQYPEDSRKLQQLAVACEFWRQIFEIPACPVPTSVRAQCYYYRYQIAVLTGSDPLKSKSGQLRYRSLMLAYMRNVSQNMGMSGSSLEQPFANKFTRKRKRADSAAASQQAEHQNQPSTFPEPPVDLSERRMEQIEAQTLAEQDVRPPKQRKLDEVPLFRQPSIEPPADQLPNQESPFVASPPQPEDDMTKLQALLQQILIPSLVQVASRLLLSNGVSADLLSDSASFTPSFYADYFNKEMKWQDCPTFQISAIKKQLNDWLEAREYDRAIEEAERNGQALVSGEGGETGQAENQSSVQEMVMVQPSQEEHLPNEGDATANMQAQLTSQSNDAIQSGLISDRIQDISTIQREYEEATQRQNILRDRLGLAPINDEDQPMEDVKPSKDAIEESSRRASAVPVQEEEVAQPTTQAQALPYRSTLQAYEDGYASVLKQQAQLRPRESPVLRVMPPSWKETRPTPQDGSDDDTQPIPGRRMRTQALIVRPG